MKNNGEGVEVRLNKRRKQKLKKNELEKPGCSSLYLFTSLHPRGDGGYALYKIDYQHLNNNNGDDDKQLSNDEQVDEVKSTALMPLLVFKPTDLPAFFCSLIPFGNYLYFIGEQPSDVFKIAKSDIHNLIPDEHNLGSKYLNRMYPPMKYPKCEPLVFVAKGNLYVISASHHRLPGCPRFEMYSPLTNDWITLNYRPNGAYGPFKSHTIVDDTVYFATSALDCGDYDESVFSYNLTHGSWKVLTTSPVDAGCYDIHPTFEAPVVPIGKLLFGGFSLPHLCVRKTVAASPYTVLNDSNAKAMIMRPTLAPQPSFWHEFNLRHKFVVRHCGPSYYMTHLQTSQGRNVLCFVSYGCCPKSGHMVAFFNFFKIPGDFYTARPVPIEEELKDTSDFCYYATQVDSECAIKSYFKSEFMHRKLFKTSLKKPSVYPGRLITCFSY